jgi:hypothetical protein
MELVVVVPTRNRADLAPATIQSALADADPRVSVLVSDNSTDPEQQEQLRSWCSTASRPRLHYVRPPRPLSMTTHWQWALERALERPQATHALYLSDRRVLRRRALTELLAMVERQPDDVLTFGDDAIVGDHERPVRLVERSWSGKLLRVDADHLLRLAARGVSHVAVPRMLNSIVPRAVLADIEQTYGTVFASIAPDHCFGYRCLDRVESILHWDRILIVQRGMLRSNGYSQIRGVASVDHADFVRELGDVGINQHAPVPALLTVTNAGYNEYEYVRGEPASSKLAEPARHFYLGANARDVSRLEDPELQARMRSVLAEHGWSTWLRIRYLLGLSASAAGYYGRRPRALLRRLRGTSTSTIEFGDCEAALSHAIEHPGDASAEAPSLWPLMSRPGAAHELKLDNGTARTWRGGTAHQGEAHS